MRLPIEDNELLLLEYGRTFAWINSVENLVELFLFIKGDIYRPDQELRRKIIERATLGRKIDLAEHLLPPDLYRKLKALNKKRILLVHGSTGAEAA